MNSLKTKLAVKRVDEIFMQYLKAKKNIDLIQGGYKYLLETDKTIDENSYINNQKSIIENVDKIYEILSLNAKKIIENDFANKINEFWWTQYYSRSTYYRHRNMAVNEFLYFYSL
jgi:hypothetical protein